jgi:hypothetical protein
MSKRATSATARSTSSCASAPLGSSSASLSISCRAASRLPSQRSARNASVSRVTRCSLRASRSVSHAGSAARSSGVTATVAPAPASAANHADDCVVRSARGNVISVTLSGSRLRACRSSACAPSVPGLPDGIRRSISLREPNRPRLALAATNASQRKCCSTMNTSRSSQPARRAAARIESAASITPSGSSPWTT